MPKTRADKAPGEWNEFVITAKGERDTIQLNGKVEIENAQIPGLPHRGPIALQLHGEGIEFRNVSLQNL